VSLSNVLSARNITERVTFLADADQDAYRAKLSPAFELQVGLHELLGHGSGKLLQADADGALNFDPAQVLAHLPPGTPSPPTHYKAGTSWDTVFGPLASTMEECRAEAVGIYLCTEPAALRIFGHEDAAEADEIVYVNWLNMARAGLLALQYYTPATKSWGQAHMQARYALLRVMLEAGQGFVEIVGADGLTDDRVAAILAEGDGGAEGGVHVRLDRAKIRTVGLPAVGAFLKSLQVHKATANLADGSAQYLRLTAVPDAYLPLRALVVARRKPRQMFVQPILREARDVEEAASSGLPRQATVVRGGQGQEDVALLTFPATVDGLIDAFVARWPEEDEELLGLWEEERARHV
jgi:dipeptidyl-peptidase-3